MSKKTTRTPPFVLVPPHISHDTIEVLEELLRDAKNGTLIGIAFAVMYKHRKYCVDATGETRRNPTWTRGMLLDLDDALSTLSKAG